MDPYSNEAAWLDDASLTIEYEGGVLPPPVSVEQTYGCACEWGHGPDSTTFGGDPVKTNTSAMFEQTRDFVTRTATGVPTMMVRTYNGPDTSDGPLGVGWRFGYQTNLDEKLPLGT